MIHFFYCFGRSASLAMMSDETSGGFCFWLVRVDAAQQEEMRKYFSLLLK
jgi:hypothetical protein